MWNIVDITSASANFSWDDNFYVIEAVVSLLLVTEYYTFYMQLNWLNARQINRIGAVWLIVCD